MMALKNWAHGASGIALGRMLMARHLPELKASAQRALDKTHEVSLEISGSLSLCHGTIGQLDILLWSEILGYGPYTEHCIHVVDLILGKWGRGKIQWPSTAPNAYEYTPSNSTRDLIYVLNPLNHFSPSQAALRASTLFLARFSVRTIQ